MNDKVRFLREINISYRKKPVGTDAPVDEPLTDPGKVFALFCDLQNELQEKLISIAVDVKLKIINFDVVAIGSVNAVTANPKDLFRSSVAIGAPGVILVHNHPAGDPTPSAADRRFHQRVLRTYRDLGIEFHDHIIIGDGRYYSFTAGKEYGS
ncbi:MAG TPA: JAB domain-containing protein [Gammaproteobacteria bacterium]